MTFEVALDLAERANSTDNFEVRDAFREAFGLRSLNLGLARYLKQREQRKSEEAVEAQRRAEQRERERQHRSSQRRIIHEAADRANFGWLPARVERRRRRAS